MSNAPPFSAESIGAVQLSGLLPQSVGTDTKEWRVFGSYAVTLILEGEGTYRDAEGARTRVGPGSLIHVFPDLAHRYHPDANGTWREFFVIFDGPLFSLWDRAGLLSRHLPVRNLAPLSYWEMRIQAVPGTGRRKSELERLREVVRLQEFLVDVREARPIATDDGAAWENEHWLAEARRLLVESMGEKHPAQAAAARARQSYQSFRKRFTRLAAVSPQQHVNAMRLERAASLLEHTDRTVQEVASELGYCDAFHFSKQFRNRFGIPPSRFRERFLARVGKRMRSGGS